MNYEIVHTCIRVLDLEKSVEFYNRALGLKEVNRKDSPQGKFTLVYMADEISGHEIELTYNYDKKEPYELGNGYSHIGLYVDDLEKSHEEHKNMGFEVTALKGLPGELPRFYFIMDPDGYAIEIIRNK